MRPAAEKIRRWLHDPIFFVRDCLGVEPDDWQAECLLAYARDPVVNPQKLDRIALKASKGPGKSTLESWIGWHFLSVWPHPKGVATSISGDNLRDNLWTELAKWQGRSSFLKNTFTWGAERIVCKHHPETWWLSARTWPKTADATQQADTLAGVHADHVLFLIDEAGGIPDAVVATAEGGLANANEEGRTATIVMAGNPTHLSGPLYRACTRERNLWWVKEISGDPDDPKRAPRVSKQWAREQIEKFGRENPWVLVNVFGQFPPGQSNTLLGVEEATASARRTMREADYIYAAKVIGVDVARYGDDTTVIFKRQGRMALQPKVFRNLSTTEVAGQVVLVIDQWKPDAVFVDQTGVGAGVVDQLRALNYEIRGVDSGGRALRAEPKLADRRAEMWWEMADWVKGGGCIPDDAELIGQLTAPTYWFDAKARLRLESKDDLKDRGMPSPDKADALALTFASPVAKKLVTAQTPQGRDYDPIASASNDYDPHARNA